VSVLTRLAVEQRAARLLMDESSTIGVRAQTIRRYALPRRAGTVMTPWGNVSVKIVERPSGPEAVPEFEDCRRLACEAGVPVRRVMLAAGHAAD